MLENIKYFIANNKRLTAIVLVSLGVLIAVVAILGLLRLAPYQSLSLTRTPFNFQDNFSFLSQGNIYSYNGLVFTETALDNGTSNILSSGQKLPLVKSMFWAEDKGALINFDGSFYGSAVERRLTELGVQLNQNSQVMSWFYDFEKNTLNKVSDFPISSRLAYFSQEKNGYYFVPDIFNPNLSDDNLADSPDSNIPLLFFSLDTLATTTIKVDLGLTDISYLGKCGDFEPCAIGRKDDDISKVGLFSISNDIQLLTETSGKIIATNDPNLFVVGQVKAMDLTIEEVNLTEVKLQLFNAQTKSQSDLGITIDNEDIIPIFQSDKFGLLNSDNESLINTYNQGAKNILSQYVTKQSKLLIRDRVYEGKLINNVSYFGEYALIDSVNNNQYIAAPDGVSIGLATVASTEEVTKNYDACASAQNITYRYFEDDRLFEAYIPDNTDQNNTLQEFSTCLFKNSNIAIGYNYRISLVDPINGRITSD